MSYKHIKFDESEVFIEFQRLLKKEAYTQEYFQDIPRQQLSEEGQKAYDASEKEMTLDVIDIGTDLAGFIPVYGDLLDVVKGIVLFIWGGEDKRFEAYCSLFAALPLAITSYMGMTAKASLKSFRAAKKAGTLKVWVKTNQKDVKFIKKYVVELKTTQGFRDLITGKVNSIKSMISALKKVGKINTIVLIGISSDVYSKIEKYFSQPTEQIVSDLCQQVNSVGDSILKDIESAEAEPA